MSYAVVRVQKMTMGSVRGIEIHDRREKNGTSHSNPDIDWSRSRNNFDLHPTQNENFYRAVKNRIESLALPRGVRKDAVVMAQVIVTSDTAFFDGLRAHGGDEAVRKFFQASYSFLSSRYGKENIISSIVHLDERTPHMHFNFVPVTADGRLCAKEVTARARLISQQDEFREVVGEHYGLLRGEAKEAGKRRTHYETAEYKTVIEELNEVRQEAVDVAQRAAEAAGMLADTEKKKNALEGEIRGLAAQHREWQSALRSEANITAVGEVVRPAFGRPRFECSPEDGEELKKAARSGVAQAIKAQEAEREVANLKKQLKLLQRNQAEKDKQFRQVQVERYRLADEFRKAKEQAARRLAFIEEKGLIDAYRQKITMERQQERDSGRER